MTQVTLGNGVVDSAAGLKIRTNGTTEAVDVSTGQVVTLAKDAVVNGVTVGRGAGSVSTNTAVGASALAANSTGAYNTAIGYQTLQASTGSDSTAVGYQALLVSTASDNDAFGYQALGANTTGTLNAGFGQYALRANTTGSNNTAIGLNALRFNTTASNNTAVGYQALYSATDNGTNTAVGYQAGYSTATGNGNNSNSFFGYQAGKSVTSGYYVTALGATALINATGIGNTGVGYGAGSAITTGSKNTILGAYTGNQGGLDIRTASNYIVLSDGDGNPRLWFHSNTVLVVPSAYSNTTAGAANLNVDSGGGITRSTSALKYKKDIRNVEDFDISVLRPVRYKSKCERDDQTKDHLGLIADEAAEAGFEELVTRNADGEVEGFQYERLTVVLLKKLQVLEAKVKELEAK